MYIGSNENEEILLQPIRKSIINLFINVSNFTKEYLTEEQQLIASVPVEEQISLLIK